MTQKTKYTVIGAGHGGKAMAGHLALMGFPTTLYNRTESHIAAIKELGGIDVESNDGSIKGFGRLELATSNIAEALEHAEMIMVVIPSSAHRDIAALCAPYFKDGQIVVLHPGRTCGAIEFAKILRDNKCKADVTISEAETFIYASRSDGPAQSRIFRIKEAVPLAALPATRTRLVLDRIHEAYPQYIDGINVLQTGLNNMGAIFHPALVILNTGWIENTHGDYQFYIDGVTPSVARILEALDRERVTVASSIGIRARTALEWLKLAYDSTGDDLYEAIQNQEGYYGIKGAPDPETPLPLRGYSHEPGTDCLAGTTFWCIGKSHGFHHSSGLHHPPHRLLAAWPHSGCIGAQSDECGGTAKLRHRWRIGRLFFRHITLKYYNLFLCAE